MYQPTTHCQFCTAIPCSGCYQKMIYELFNPPKTQQPFFKGYKPQFYFRTVISDNTEQLTSLELHYLNGD